MARTVLSVKGSTLSDFVDAVNAAIVTLTDKTFLSVRIECGDQERIQGLELLAVIDYEDGGTALSDPFILTAVNDTNMADAVAAATTAINASSDYISPVRSCVIDPARRIPLNLVFYFSNADSANAANNWLAG